MKSRLWRLANWAATDLTALFPVPRLTGGGFIEIPEAQRDQPELSDPAATAPDANSGAKYDLLMRRALKQARN